MLFLLTGIFFRAQLRSNSLICLCREVLQFWRDVLARNWRGSANHSDSHNVAKSIFFPNPAWPCFGQRAWAQCHFFEPKPVWTGQASTSFGSFPNKYLWKIIINYIILYPVNKNYEILKAVLFLYFKMPVISWLNFLNLILYLLLPFLKFFY